MILNIINEATTKFFIMVDFDLRIKVGRRGFLKHDISHHKTPPFLEGFWKFALGSRNHLIQIELSSLGLMTSIDFFASGLHFSSK